MSAERIQVEYENLARISREFTQYAEQVEAMQKRIRANVEQLSGGRWVGEGASAFYREMDHNIFPPLGKLSQAFHYAQETVDDVAALFEEAETSASQPFLKDGAGFPPIIAMPLPVYPGIINLPGYPIWENPNVIDVTRFPMEVDFGYSGGSGGYGNSTIAYDSAVQTQTPSFWEHVEAEGFYGVEGYRSSSEIDAGIGIGVMYTDSLYDADDLVRRNEIFGYDIGGAKGDFHAGEYSFGAGAGYHVEKGAYAGLMGDFTAAEFSGVNVLGSSGFGHYSSGELDVLELEGFAGYKDGSVGAMIGGNLVEAELGTGFNAGGYRIGIKGSAGVGFSAGVQVGKETKVKFGPFGVGIDIGKAYDVPKPGTGSW